MYTTTKLLSVENSRNITKEDDSEFFFELQRGVLLTLKENGTLNEMQYRAAEEMLKEQRKELAKSLVEGG